MKFGIHEDYLASETKLRWLGVTFTRTFVGDWLTPGSLIPGFTYYCQPSWDAGLTPIVSFKPRHTDVSSGSWDSWFREIGTWLRDKPETYVVVHHEPEDDITALQFQAMFTRARNNLKANFPGLRVGTAAMAYHWNAKWNNPNVSYTGTTDKPEQWRVQADFYGIDIYSGFESHVNTILPEISGFARWASLFVPVGAPIIVTERGFKITTDAQRAERITGINREAVWLKSQDPLARQISAYCYWSSTGVENDPLMVLEPAGEAALAHLFSSVNEVPPPVSDRYEEGYSAGHEQGFSDGKVNSKTKMQQCLDGM